MSSFPPEAVKAIAAEVGELLKEKRTGRLCYYQADKVGWQPDRTAEKKSSRYVEFKNSNLGVQEKEAR